jgi:hypothetical protein
LRVLCICHEPDRLNLAEAFALSNPAP